MSVAAVLQHVQDDFTRSWGLHSFQSFCAAGVDDEEKDKQWLFGALIHTDVCFQ